MASLLILVGISQTCFDQFHHPCLLTESFDNYVDINVQVYTSTNLDDHCAPVPGKLLKYTPNNFSSMQPANVLIFELQHFLLRAQLNTESTIVH